MSDLVTDIAQNAAESGAARMELEIAETGGGKREFRFLVRDNGRGMDQGEIRRAVDPFVTDGKKHPGRKVGLGIPFLIQTAQQSGGGWNLESEKGRGTEISAWFDLDNVDTPPAGDLPGMFRTVLMFEGPGECIIRRTRAGLGADLDYEVCKTELAEALGNLEDTGSLVLLDKYLRSLEEDED
ncbi:MAG: ATP-binding protein [Treponema sp.]|nr:ATP-binding protein [Treponema sp.]